MKCQRCNREMKNHHPSGLGEICRKKQEKGTPGKATVKVIPLSQNKLKLPKRSYLVLGEQRAVVIIKDTGTDKWAECQVCDFRCSHLELVAEMDNALFPQ